MRHLDRKLKAKFSEVIDLALSPGPQTVTRNGRTAVVIVAAKEWERKTKRGLTDGTETLPSSGPKAVDLAVDRSADLARCFCASPI